MRNASIIFPLVAINAFLTPGCKRTPEPIIVGHVVDNFGNPFVGAMASIRDSAFRTTTDSHGDFTLGFAPGSFHLTIEAPGSVPWSHVFQLTQAVRYPLGTKLLIRIPDGPPETVFVAVGQSFQPLPSAELGSRVVTFGPYFPNRCAEFSIRATQIPVIRGSTLLAVFPDPHFSLVRVDDMHITTDPFPYTTGVCPGVTHRVEVRGVDAPGHSFFITEPPANGPYCFIRSTRADPAQPENGRGYCFNWLHDAGVLYGSVMTSLDELGRRCSMNDAGRIPCIPECLLYSGLLGTLEATRQQGLCYPVP